MLARALNDSRTVYIAKSHFFTYSPPKFDVVPNRVTRTVRVSKSEPELRITKYTPTAFVSQIDAFLVVEKRGKKIDIITTDEQKQLPPGISLNVTTKDSYYNLGSSVSVTISLSMMEFMHIDSISYRVSFLAVTFRSISTLFMKLCQILLYSLLVDRFIVIPFEIPAFS